MTRLDDSDSETADAARGAATIRGGWRGSRTLSCQSKPLSESRKLSRQAGPSRRGLPLRALDRHRDLRPSRGEITRGAHARPDRTSLRRQRFQHLCFPDGIAFDGNGFVGTTVEGRGHCEQQPEKHRDHATAEDARGPSAIQGSENQGEHGPFGEETVAPLNLPRQYWMPDRRGVA